MQSLIDTFWDKEIDKLSRIISYRIKRVDIEDIKSELYLFYLTEKDNLSDKELKRQLLNCGYNFGKQFLSEINMSTYTKNGLSELTDEDIFTRLDNSNFGNLKKVYHYNSPCYYNQKTVKEIWNLRYSGLSWKKIENVTQKNSRYVRNIFKLNIEREIEGISYKKKNIILSRDNHVFYKKRGENHGMAIHSDSQIEALLLFMKKNSSNLNMKIITKKFNINSSSVYEIARNLDLWKHIRKKLNIESNIFSLGRNICSNGEKNINAKLNSQKVKEMRTEHKKGATIASLAKKNKVSTTVVSYAIKRKTWKHVA